MQYQPLGNVTVAVHSLDFLSGMQAGYDRFKISYQPKTSLSEGDISAFITHHFLCCTFRSEAYNLGFITGWYQAWFEPATGRTP